MNSAKVTARLTRKLPSMKGVGVVANGVKRLYKHHAAPIETDVLGSQMRLDLREFMEREFCFTPQYYEPENVAHVQRVLREGDAFLDIGANVGFYTLLASRLVGQTGKVLSIEATPKTHSRLLMNLELNHTRNVHAPHVAVSDTEGEAMIFGAIEAGNAGGWSMLGKKDEKHTAAKVQTKRLWTLMQEAGISQVRVAKLDIEGMEWRVLHRFFQDAPESAWPAYFLIEAHTEGWLAHGDGDALKIAQANGYKVIAKRYADHVLARI